MALFHHVARLSLLLLLSNIRTANALCYTPDKSISNDISCNPSSDNGTASICCKRGYYCTEANLCLKEGHANATGFAFDGVYVRGTCSDQTWQSPECLGICVSGNPSGGEGVVHCGGGIFCCGIDASCCDTQDNLMDLGIPNIYATAGIQATTTAALPSGTGNPSETEDTKAMQEQLDKARNERNTRAIAVGLGVGIPLGLLLIAAIAGGWWWMKRTRRLMEARAAQLKAEEKYRVMQSELGGSGRIEVPGQSPWAEVDGRAAWEVDGKDRWAEMGAKEGVIRRVEMP